VKKSVFPPPLLAHLDRRAAGNLLSLARQLRSGDSAFFLGAGVSASAGVPAWRDLLHRIAATFFYHWEYDIEAGYAEPNKAPTGLSIAFWDDIFWSDSALAAAEAVGHEDALFVAQQLKNCIDERNWQYLLRKLIYGDDATGYTTGPSPLISTLCALIRACIPAAIINYNYDDLVEQELRRSGYAFVPIWKGRWSPSTTATPVFHPHGYLPLGGGPSTSVILGESEYQQEATEPYAWSNLIQLQFLNSHCCIFVGHSLIDPNVRRLLRIASSVPGAQRRYAFLPSASDPDRFETMRQSLFDNDLNRLGVRPIRFPAGSLRDPQFDELPRLLSILVAGITNPAAFWEGA